MDKNELAARLHGREYNNEIDNELAGLADDAGLVVMFGASDDLVQFRGTIHDEAGASNRKIIYLDKDGLLENKCSDDDCPYFARLQKQARQIKVNWSGAGWSYTTDIPHATFDIMEEGELYCRGIVFALADVG